jgi:hypothetical protein
LDQNKKPFKNKIGDKEGFMGKFGKIAAMTKPVILELT